MSHRPFLRAAAVWILVPCLLAAACATVPATGGKQLSFFSEEEEIAMGREADAEIVGSIGVYDDPAMQAYVDEVGRKLAAVSERPQLPWTFQVIDDASVNAFALPGGWIYVTRGILTHLGSESELAAVLGHEVGHVTARHGVHQVSKEILATVGVGLLVLLDPDLGAAAGAAALGLGILFLKNGRDDERQADDLGLRYLSRGGWDPRPMPEVFAMLKAVGEVEAAAAGGGRLPNWLSTHPDPGARRQRIEEAIAATGEDYSARPSGRDEYVTRLDGMVFGADPRQGFFQGQAFLHPDFEFRFDFPEGWETVNSSEAVAGSHPDGEAELQLTVSAEATPQAAADAFYAGEEAIEEVNRFRQAIHGAPAVWSRFEADVEGTEISGLLAFVAHGGNVFQLVGYTEAANWNRHQSSIERSLQSFRRLTDRAALAIEPQRLEIVRLPREMTLEAFAQRWPSSVDLATLALINHAQPGEILPRARALKRVVGPPPPT